MKTKLVNFQCFYEVPIEGYTHVARNYNGILCGFKHPPIRDFTHKEWIDSVDGSTGEIIPYDKWDMSVRSVQETTDMREAPLKRRRTLEREASLLGKPRPVNTAPYKKDGKKIPRFNERIL